MRFPPPHDGDQRIDLGEIIVAAQVRCNADRTTDQVGLLRRQIELDLTDEIVIHVHAASPNRTDGSAFPTFTVSRTYCNHGIAASAGGWRAPQTARGPPCAR